MLGFLVQVILAKRFGIGVEIDTYLYAISLPTFIASIISTMLNFSITPRIVMEEGNHKYQASYLKTIFCLLLVTSTFLVIPIGVMFSKLQEELLPEYSVLKGSKELDLLIYIAWLICGAQIILGYMIAALNSFRSHSIAASIAILPYLGILVLMGLIDQQEIKLVPIGMLIGVILAIITSLILLKDKLFPIRRIDFIWTEARELIYGMPFSMLGMTCFSSYLVIDAFWAPYTESGALAILGYSQRIVIGFGNLAIVGPFAVIAPELAKYITTQSYAEFRSLLKRSLFAVGFISTSMSIGLYIYSKKVIEIMFLRGKFGEQEVNLVSNCLNGMLPGMVAMLLSAICFRALYCLPNRNKTIATIGLLWALLYFMLSWMLYRNGVFGLALAYSATWVIILIILLILIFKSLNLLNNFRKSHQ